MEMTKHPSGLPADIRRFLLGDLKPWSDEQAEYRIKLRDVLFMRKAWCLTVFGSIGNGKSHLAKVAVNTFNDRGYKGGIYTTQPRIQAELKGDGMRVGDVFQKYATAKCLVIDEMSDRPNDWTEFVKTSVENILVERHSMELPTVIIGNLDGPRLLGMFDERVKDRLNEGLVMQMKHESFRRAYGD